MTRDEAVPMFCNDTVLYDKIITKVYDLAVGATGHYVQSHPWDILHPTVKFFLNNYQIMRDHGI